ncbi:hypothetical protein [Bosea sp. TAB14]|uniref:hypothetical protein n=1 Tax=Bosea sp. TAB14 TaxID=3237481 RepID=UPI003F92B623
MTMIRQTAVSLAAMMMLATPALAQQRNLGPSTGTVRIEQVQAGFIAGGEAGGGTLRYHGPLGADGVLIGFKQ